MQIKTKNGSCHTADSKPVKQEVNSTVILPPLVFPGLSIIPSKSGSCLPHTDLEGVELLFHQKGGSASFGAKMALSLNGVDPSCMNSIVGSTCRAKRSNILNDSTIMSQHLIPQPAAGFLKPVQSCQGLEKNQF